MEIAREWKWAREWEWNGNGNGNGHGNGHENGHGNGEREREWELCFCEFLQSARDPGFWPVLVTSCGVLATLCGSIARTCRPAEVIVKRYGSSTRSALAQLRKTDTLKRESSARPAVVSPDIRSRRHKITTGLWGLSGSIQPFCFLILCSVLDDRNVGPISSKKKKASQLWIEGEAEVGFSANWGDGEGLACVCVYVYMYMQPPWF